MNIAISDAILTHHLLRLNYDGYLRVVEPHAYGVNGKDHEVLRAYQVSGGSVHNEPTGWKLLRLDETRGLQMLADTFASPRPGYKRGDKDMRQIYSQL